MIVIVSGIKSATIVPGNGWEKRWGCKSFWVESWINSAGHGGKTFSVRFANVERRLCIWSFSSSFNGNFIFCGSSSLIDNNLFGEFNETVDKRRPILIITSSFSLGGMGSGQCVVPVTEITSLPRKPNGLARDNSWCVKSLIDWRRWKPVDDDVEICEELFVVKSTFDVFVEAGFERGRFDSVMELFDWRIVEEIGVPSPRIVVTVVCPSTKKKKQIIVFHLSLQYCFQSIKTSEQDV